MKKASLGFRYISLDDEFRIPDLKDFEDARIDRRMSSHDKAKLRKLRCYTKHKEQYNKQKRSVARSIAGRYEEAKRKARKEHLDWSFDRETWEQAWISAGWVKTPKGDLVPAFALRGGHRYNNTCMVRKDLNLGWSPANTQIVFRGEELVPGSRWYHEAPELCQLQN